MTFQGVQIVQSVSFFFFLNSNRSFFGDVLQCFDLGSFLDMNKSPSGQRWKCGHCENFLSHEDLEHCALTEKASRQFGDQIGSLQHMVEFKEDGSMSLCKPVRSHQERVQAKKLATKESQSGSGAQDVVEILDSDSD